MSELRFSSSGAASRLSIRQLSLAFGGLQVLRGIDLDLWPSQVVALIGPNGAGKSALLNCVSGIYRPDVHSRIALSGQRIDGLPAHRIAAAGVSRTFQGLQLAGGLSVLDNILAGLSGLPGLGLAASLWRPFAARQAENDARHRAHEAAERCGLAEFLHVPCASLPLGVLRRVDLARALVRRPQLLLLDEPASGLSHDERPLISEMVDLARAQGDLAVLWIEHDLELVLNVAERAVVLHHGELVDSGDPRNEGERARIVASYTYGKQQSQAA